MIKMIIYGFTLVVAFLYDLLIRLLEWISDLFGKIYVEVKKIDDRNTV